jgi:peptidoglycan/LPS O-acetylase OafA/YrhL
MNEIEQLKNDIKQIQDRNARVEVDKAWEVSSARKILVAVLTYIIVVLFFLVSDLPRPFVNALVPTIGYILSTLSVSAVKGWWVGRRE